MPRKSYKNIGLTLPNFEMCEQLEEKPLQGLISLPEASPAKILAAQEGGQELQESNQAFGRNSTVSFANYDHDTCWWRTSQLCFIPSSENETGERSASNQPLLAKFLVTWPRAGMMRNGKCYQRKHLVRHISGKGPSLWRTPQVADSKSAQLQSGYTTNLTHQVLFPTPLATDAIGGSSNRSPGSSHVRPSLARMATGNRWPTPRATDGNHGGPNARDSKGNYALSGAVHHWPTPTSSPWKSGKSSEATLQRNSRPLSEIAAQGQASGQLNPTWVEWLMGFPQGWTDLEA
jgi:hypothetical protein